MTGLPNPWIDQNRPTSKYIKHRISDTYRAVTTNKRLVRLESKSSSVDISIGAGSFFSKDVRNLWNFSQSTCCQLSFGVSGVSSIEVSRVVVIGK